MSESWTKTEVELLRRLYPDRTISVTEISSTLKKGVKAVHSKARRLGISRKAWTQADDDYLKNNYHRDEDVIRSIARALNRTERAVISRASRLGLLDQVNVWTDDEIELLRQIYLDPNYSVEMIQAALPGRTYNAIMTRAGILGLGSRRRAGLVRKHDFDLDYFESIDTPEKAYWLGFIYADGSLAPNNTLRIGLHKEAKKHLTKFAKAVGYTGKIRGPDKDGRYDLDLTSKKFAEDLRDKGVVENKTFIVRYPDFLSRELNRHFIRGVFDGDGTITTHKSRYRERVYEAPFMAIVGGAPRFLREVVSILSQEVGVKRVKTIQRKVRGESTGTWAFSYTGAPSLRVRDYLYHGATVFMESKRERFFSFDYGSSRPHDKLLQTERLKDLVESRGGKLLSEYSGYDGVVKLRCSRGHKWETAYKNLVAGKGWCGKCTKLEQRQRRLAKSEKPVHKALAEKGWSLISEYEGRTKEITVRCEHGRDFSGICRTIIAEGAVCPCNRGNTLESGLQNLRIRLKKLGWTLRSDYTGFFDKVTVQCKHGKQFRRVAGNIKPSSKCPCERKSSSGPKNVYPTASGRWYVYLSLGGQHVHLGTFDTVEEARNARDSARENFRSHSQD